MLTVKLDSDIEKRLNELCEATGRSKSFYVHEALEAFFAERDDYLLAIKVLDNDEPTIGLEELRRELDHE